MNRRHRRTLEAIFARPTGGNIAWRDALALFSALGADVEERAGSRVLVRLFGQRRIYHRPHPSPHLKLSTVADIRDWLRQNGVTP